MDPFVHLLDGRLKEPETMVAWCAVTCTRVVGEGSAPSTSLPGDRPFVFASRLPEAATCPACREAWDRTETADKFRALDAKNHAIAAATECVRDGVALDRSWLVPDPPSRRADRTVLYHRLCHDAPLVGYEIHCTDPAARLYRLSAGDAHFFEAINGGGTEIALLEEWAEAGFGLNDVREHSVALRARTDVMVEVEAMAGSTVRLVLTTGAAAAAAFDAAESAHDAEDAVDGRDEHYNAAAVFSSATSPPPTFNELGLAEVYLIAREDLRRGQQGGFVYVAPGAPERLHISEVHRGASMEGPWEQVFAEECVIVLADLERCAHGLAIGTETADRLFGTRREYKAGEVLELVIGGGTPGAVAPSFLLAAYQHTVELGASDTLEEERLHQKAEDDRAETLIAEGLKSFGALEPETAVGDQGEAREAWEKADGKDDAYPRVQIIGGSCEPFSAEGRARVCVAFQAPFRRSRRQFAFDDPDRQDGVRIRCVMHGATPVYHRLREGEGETPEYFTREFTSFTWAGTVYPTGRDTPGGLAAVAARCDGVLGPEREFAAGDVLEIELEGGTPGRLAPRLLLGGYAAPHDAPKPPKELPPGAVPLFLLDPDRLGVGEGRLFLDLSCTSKGYFRVVGADGAEMLRIALSEALATGIHRGLAHLHLELEAPAFSRENGRVSARQQAECGDDDAPPMLMGRVCVDRAGSTCVYLVAPAPCVIDGLRFPGSFLDTRITEIRCGDRIVYAAPDGVRIDDVVFPAGQPLAAGEILRVTCAVPFACDVHVVADITLLTRTPMAGDRHDDDDLAPIVVPRANRSLPSWEAQVLLEAPQRIAGGLLGTNGQVLLALRRAGAPKHHRFVVTDELLDALTEARERLDGANVDADAKEGLATYGPGADELEDTTRPDRLRTLRDDHLDQTLRLSLEDAEHPAGPVDAHSFDLLLRHYVFPDRRPGEVDQGTVDISDWRTAVVMFLWDLGASHLSPRQALPPLWYGQPPKPRDYERMCALQRRVRADGPSVKTLLDHWGEVILADHAARGEDVVAAGVALAATLGLDVLEVEGDLRSRLLAIQGPRSDTATPLNSEERIPMTIGQVLSDLWACDIHDAPLGCREPARDPDPPSAE